MNEIETMNKAGENGIVLQLILDEMTDAKHRHLSTLALKATIHQKSTFSHYVLNHMPFQNSNFPLET